MKKKIIVTISTTVIITLIFIIAKNLIYGTETDYIANYMPKAPIQIGNTIISGNSGSFEGFASLAHKTTMSRLFGFIIFNILFSIFYTVILFKTKLYTAKKDIIYTLIVFIVPLRVCYTLIYSQLGCTF
jgi:hypothetical protein